MIFQVTGLSRSGTAWMATFLNLHPNCYAHHDLAAETDDWLDESEELASMWEYVGEVSTYGWLPKATRRTGPKVFIHRDPYEVFKSLWNATKERPILTNIQAQHAVAIAWAKEQKALIVPFVMLHDESSLMLIWHHIFGTFSRYPRAKARLLTKMNIQRNDLAEMISNPEQAQERLFS